MALFGVVVVVVVVVVVGELGLGSICGGGYAGEELDEESEVAEEEPG